MSAWLCLFVTVGKASGGKPSDCARVWGFAARKGEHGNAFRFALPAKEGWWPCRGKSVVGILHIPRRTEVCLGRSVSFRCASLQTVLAAPNPGLGPCEGGAQSSLCGAVRRAAHSSGGPPSARPYLWRAELGQALLAPGFPPEIPILSRSSLPPPPRSCCHRLCDGAYLQLGGRGEGENALLSRLLDCLHAVDDRLATWWGQSVPFAGEMMLAFAVSAKFRPGSAKFQSSELVRVQQRGPGLPLWV